MIVTFVIEGPEIEQSLATLHMTSPPQIGWDVNIFDSESQLTVSFIVERVLLRVLRYTETVKASVFVYLREKEPSIDQAGGQADGGR